MRQAVPIDRVRVSAHHEFWIKENLNRVQSSPAILTGEDAVKLTQDEEETPQILKKFIVEGESDENENDWQDQLSKRAGIAIPPSTKASTSLNNSNGYPLVSLDQIKNNFKTALAHIETNMKETSSSLARVDVEITSAEKESKASECALIDSKEKLRFHEHIRSEILPLMEQLRKINTKSILVRNSLEDLYASEVEGRMNRWIEDGRDVSNLLWKNDVDAPDVAVVDEFGRDITSSKTIALQRRLHRRRERISSLLSDAEDKENLLIMGKTHASTTDTEIHENDFFLKKRLALSQAMMEAMKSFPSHESLFPRLFDVAMEWKRENGEEYKQCFAQISFAELMAAPLTVDICQYFDFLGLPTNQDLVSGINHIPYFQSISQHLITHQDSDTLPLILSKSIHPCVCQIIRRGYDPFSKRQTQLLFTFLSSLRKHQREQETSEQFHTLFQMLKATIQNIPIVLLPPSTHHPQNYTQDEMIASHVQTFFIGQVYKYQKLLLNLICYWNDYYMSSSLSSHEWSHWILATLVRERCFPSIDALESSIDNAMKNDITKDILGTVKEIAKNLMSNMKHEATYPYRDIFSRCGL